MHISDKLANENWERNQNWTTKPTTKTQPLLCLHLQVKYTAVLDVKPWIKMLLIFCKRI